MAGAGLTDYEQAYGKVHRGGGGIIHGASSLAGMGSATIRAASDEGKLGEGVDKLKRTRETTDLVWRMNNYKTINCSCGTKLRVPPKFKGHSVRCPHCGKIHSIQ